jgi:hypothetical protein
VGGGLIAGLRSIALVRQSQKLLIETEIAIKGESCAVLRSSDISTFQIIMLQRTSLLMAVFVDKVAETRPLGSGVEI